MAQLQKEMMRQREQNSHKNSEQFQQIQEEGSKDLEALHNMFDKLTSLEDAKIM